MTFLKNMIRFGRTPQGKCLLLMMIPSFLIKCARFDNMETVSDDRSTIDRGIYGVNRLRISFYIDRTNY